MGDNNCGESNSFDPEERPWTVPMEVLLAATAYEARPSIQDLVQATGPEPRPACTPTFHDKQQSLPRGWSRINAERVWQSSCSPELA